MTAFSRLRMGFNQKWIIAALLFVITIQVQAQTAAGVEASAPAPPGPPMWKVSKGDHTLWIFGILTPLEYGVIWKSEQVESVINQSQEYIYIKNPKPKIPLNPFKFINGIRLVLKIRHNPDGLTLDEVLPEDLYLRYSKLVEFCPFADDVEEVRPMYAADGLLGMAVINNSLTEDHGVDIRIESLGGRQHGLCQ